METIIAINDNHHIPVEMKARLDEFNLDITVTYQGIPLVQAQSFPSIEELEDEKSSAEMSIFRVQRDCDRLVIERKDDSNILKLHFVH